MGAGKRDRERPHLNPSSTSEYLFYRGLLARAFFDTDKGSQEFAYIPDDLLLLIENIKDNEPPIEIEALGRPASPGEKGTEILADDSHFGRCDHTTRRAPHGKNSGLSQLAGGVARATSRTPKSTHISKTHQEKHDSNRQSQNLS